MAKKFGKFLLFTAAVGTAAAAVYYYLQKKDVAGTVPEDEDYDDFSEDLDDDAEGSRSYVPLNTESKPEAQEKEEKQDNPSEDKPEENKQEESKPEETKPETQDNPSDESKPVEQEEFF